MKRLEYNPDNSNLFRIVDSVVDMEIGWGVIADNVDIEYANRFIKIFIRDHSRRRMETYEVQLTWKLITNVNS